MKYLFSILLICFTASAQTTDPEKIIELVQSNYDKIEDYQAEIHIELDISFLEVPESDATVYYKRPDKFTIESDRFVMIPKEGLNLSPLEALKGDFTGVYVKEDTVRGDTTAIVKVIPLSQNEEVILITLWVDRQTYFIKRAESSSAEKGTISIDFFYRKDRVEYPLPEKVLFSFNLKNITIPKFDMGLDDTRQDSEQKEEIKEGKGTVVVTYKNYKINEGVPDEVFEEHRVITD